MIQPEPSSRHPLIVFLLALCLISGVGMVAGNAPKPNSLEASLPAWQALAWAWALLLGALSTITGISLQPYRLRDGVLLEQVGMATLCPAAIIYAGAAFGQLGWSAFLSAGILFGLGLSCGYRWWTLQKDIQKSKRLRAMVSGVNAHGDRA